MPSLEDFNTSTWEINATNQNRNSKYTWISPNSPHINCLFEIINKQPPQKEKLWNSNKETFFKNTQNNFPFILAADKNMETFKKSQTRNLLTFQISKTRFLYFEKIWIFNLNKMRKHTQIKNSSIKDVPQLSSPMNFKIWVTIQNIHNRRKEDFGLWYFKISETWTMSPP